MFLVLSIHSRFVTKSVLSVKCVLYFICIYCCAFFDCVSLFVPIIDTVLLIKTQNLIANSSGNLDSSNNNNSNYSNNNISCNNNNKVSTLISNSYNHSGKLFKQQADDHVTASILSHKTMDYVRRNSYGDISMFFYYLVLFIHLFLFLEQNQRILIIIL